MLKIIKGGAVECQENVRFAEKVRFPEIMFPTQTDIAEESGMQIFRQ